MSHDRVQPNEVGPVLLAGRVTDAIVAAIRKQNAGARVSLRGSYVRVSVPERCEVDAAVVQQMLGERFHMIQDLERVMPSFRGRLSLSEHAASWEAGAAPPLYPEAAARREDR
jgi:toluene monooxygenase system protein D